MINNQKGFSIIGSLLASGLIIMTFYSLTTWLNVTQKQFAQQMTKKEGSQVVLNLFTEIRSNIDQYRVNFDHSKDALKNKLSPDKLFLTWKDGHVCMLKDCPDQIGRIGYLIQPMDGIKGLYLITVRVVNNVERQEDFVDYQQVVSLK